MRSAKVKDVAGAFAGKGADNPSRRGGRGLLRREDGVLPWRFLGDGVWAALTKWMTAQKAQGCKTRPAQGSVAAEGLLRIHAAARNVAAVPADEWGEGHAIGLNQEEQKPGDAPWLAGWPGVGG